MARQEPDLVKVADECRAVAQRNVTITDYEPILSLKGDCTRVEDMVDVRSRVQTGTSYTSSKLVAYLDS